MSLPALPAQGETPWYSKRAAWDAAVDDLVSSGRLSSAQLAAQIAAAIASHVAAGDPHAQYLTAAEGAAAYATAAQGAKADTAVQPASLTESVQDIVGAMLVSGGSLTLSYDDTAGTVTLTGGGGADAETIRDVVGAALIGLNGITVALNDAGDTITFGLSSVSQSVVTNLTTDLAARVRTDTATQGLNSTQQSNARTNIAAAPATGISADALTAGTTNGVFTLAEKAKLADLSGNIYVTTTNGTLPGSLADLTVIARYAATVPGTPTVVEAGYTVSTSTGSVAVTTTSEIAAGDIIAVAFTRGTASSTAGSAAVTLGAGAIDSWASASAQRTGVVEVELLTAKVTTTIPLGTTITVASSTNSNNRAIVAVASIHNVSTGAPDATTGDDAAGVASTSSAGANASATTLTATTDSSTTVANTLVLGLFGFNTSQTWAFSSGTQVSYQTTTAGSSDRGLILGYRVATSVSQQGMTVTAAGATGVAGVTVALPLSMVQA